MSQPTNIKIFVLFVNLSELMATAENRLSKRGQGPVSENVNAEKINPRENQQKKSTDASFCFREKPESGSHSRTINF